MNINNVNVIQSPRLEDNMAFKANGNLYISNRDRNIYRLCFINGVSDTSISMAISAGIERVFGSIKESDIGFDFLEKIYSL